MKCSVHVLGNLNLWSFTCFRSDPDTASKPQVRSTVLDENQKSELKPPEVVSEVSKVMVADDKKQVGSDNDHNNGCNNNGILKPHQVEREGNCYW
jgi:hypothetical protein